MIEVPAGKSRGWAVVIDPGLADDQPRPLIVTAERQARRLSMVDFPTPVEALTRVRVPKSFSSRNPQMRRDIASALHSATHGLDPYPGRLAKNKPDNGQVSDPVNDQVSRLRAQLQAHPCHRCPDREEHARWGERWFKLERDTATLRRRIEKRTNSVSRQFDRVCEVLLALEYLEPSGPDGSLIVTDRGQHLMRLYSELDLLAAEAIRRGVWDALKPSELAAALSVLVYEARRPDDNEEARMPSPAVAAAIKETMRLWRDLDVLERSHSLDFLRPPDPGFAWAAQRWAEGEDLDEVLNGIDLAAGDFVRNMKQLIDLTGQVADASGDSPLRTTAKKTIESLRHGVVAYSNLN